MSVRKPSAAEPLVLPGRMTATDALFWYAESALPTFRPIIAGLYVLDRRPQRAGIEQGLATALATVPRLRQRVVEVPGHLGLPEWVDDPHFDATYHLRHVSLPAPGSRRELLDLAASLLATPLDRERPLWEAYWIDGLQHGRAAYFFKMHHSVVDGVGSVALMQALTQSTRQGGVRRPATPVPSAPPRAAAAPLASLARDTAAESARLALRAARWPLALLTDPVASVAKLRRTLRGLRGVMADLARPAIRDPLAAGSGGLSRRLDVMQVPLARLQHLKEPLGVTINDIVLAALAGTLGAYHREHHVHVPSLNCMVPMNLRGRDERDTLGNRVGTFTVALPIGERRPERRLELITQQTRAAKSDRRGAAWPFLVQSLTLLPGAAVRWIARQSLGRVNVACTNIPGTTETRYMAGARIEALYPFASVVEGTPLVMALFSYAGSMDIGIDTDPEAIPDPERIHELLDESLDELERLAGRRAPRTPVRRIA
jgi:diacylglycerol O-acyltransferase